MAKMAMVQRQAALHATGALTTTLNDTLNAHANLPPFDITVHQILHQNTLRLAMLATTHPLMPYVRWASKRYVKAHQSPLHKLFKAFKVKPEHTEKIENVCRGPQYELHFKVEIAKNKDEAKKKALANKAEYQVFSDSSEIEGKVGAAATLYRNGIEQLTLRYHLGSATKYGIAKAKLVGELLAAFMLSQPQMQYKQATIGVDNTATLYNMRNQKLRGVHYLLDAVHNYMEKAIAIGPIGQEITMAWTLGHVGIDGNERVDEEAKKVAKGDSSPASTLPPILHRWLPASKSAAQKEYKKSTKATLQKRMQTLKQMQKTRTLDPMFKPAQFKKMAMKLPRRHMSILVHVMNS
jgi:hypothetical protein